jgi:septum site-determining protein MinD
MNAKIICLASAKGGSGKTGLSATLGAFLSKLGKRVLLIDSDFATCGLTLLYIKEVQVAAELVLSKSAQPSGLAEVLSSTGAIRIDRVVIGEELDLLPVSFNLVVPDAAIGDETRHRFAILLSHLREEYDFIFIDSQAGADRMARISMDRAISDEVIIVTEYDPMSAAGVERLKAALREDLTYDRTWILLNKILPEFVKSFSDFLSVAKYLSPIPWNAEVVRSYARRNLAINSEAGADYTLSIIQLVKGLLGDSIKKELSEWIESRAAAIRQPIEEQYHDAEIELKSILLSQYEIEQTRRKRRILGNTILFGFAIVVTAGTALITSPELSTRFADLFGIAKIPLFSVIAAVGATLGFVFKSVSPSNAVDVLVNESRLQRQQTLLEEKLKRLELLRTLEPEMLLRHRLEQ